MKFLLAITAASLLAFGMASPSFAQSEGKKVGFGVQSEEPTQGNSGKTNDNANSDNEGQTVETTTGPRGQLAKGETDCNNCDTDVDLPGKNR